MRMLVMHGRMRADKSMHEERTRVHERATHGRRRSSRPPLHTMTWRGLFREMFTHLPLGGEAAIAPPQQAGESAILARYDLDGIFDQDLLRAEEPPPGASAMEPLEALRGYTWQALSQAGPRQATKIAGRIIRLDERGPAGQRPVAYVKDGTDIGALGLVIGRAAQRPRVGDLILGVVVDVQPAYPTICQVACTVRRGASLLLAKVAHIYDEEGAAATHYSAAVSFPWEAAAKASLREVLPSETFATYIGAMSANQGSLARLRVRLIGRHVVSATASCHQTTTLALLDDADEEGTVTLDGGRFNGCAISAHTALLLYNVSVVRREEGCGRIRAHVYTTAETLLDMAPPIEGAPSISGAPARARTPSSSKGERRRSIREHLGLLGGLPPGARETIKGVVGYVTRVRLSPALAIIYRCEACKRNKRGTPPHCPCTMQSGQRASAAEDTDGLSLSFSIPIAISDESGTWQRLTLNDEQSRHILQVTPRDFVSRAAGSADDALPSAYEEEVRMRLLFEPLTLTITATMTAQEALSVAIVEAGLLGGGGQIAQQ